VDGHRTEQLSFVGARNKIGGRIPRNKMVLVELCVVLMARREP